MNRLVETCLVFPRLICRFRDKFVSKRAASSRIHKQLFFKVTRRSALKLSPIVMLQAQEPTKAMRYVKRKQNSTCASFCVLLVSLFANCKNTERALSDDLLKSNLCLAKDFSTSLDHFVTAESRKSMKCFLATNTK